MDPIKIQIQNGFVKSHHSRAGWKPGAAKTFMNSPTRWLGKHFSSVFGFIIYPSL
jgi:hypothetical protein